MEGLDLGGFHFFGLIFYAFLGFCHRDGFISGGGLNPESPLNTPMTNTICSITRPLTSYSHSTQTCHATDILVEAQT